MGARVNLVGGENFVNDAHGEKSLAKQKRVSSGQWRKGNEATFLELRFDGFGDIVVTGKALEFFNDFAVATDEEAGGISEQAAELVGDFVATKDDGIVHRKLLAVDVEAFLSEERNDRTLAVFVHGDAQDREALGGVLLLHFNEPGDFDVTRVAPGGPEIDEDDSALVLRESDVFAIEVF